MENQIIGTKIKPTNKKPVEIGIDTSNQLVNDIIDEAEVNQVDLGTLESFTTVAQTREQIYTLIDTMSQDETISAILETYAEDTVETNDSGKIMWCESGDEKISKYITYILDSLNVDKNIYSWVYNLIKYGDLYLKLYRESDYADDVLFGNKEKSKLHEDVKVNINSQNDHYVHYVEMVANPGEMFELTKFGKTMGYIQAPATIQQTYDLNNILNSYLTYKMKRKDVNVYNATDYVHACLQNNVSRNPEEVQIFLNDNDLENNNASTTYTVKKGQSILYNSFKIWRELALLENSVLLNRLTKSAVVRVLNVDIGDMPKEQVNQFIHRLKEKIEQKSALNIDKSMTEFTNPGPIENVIYIPTHGTQGQIQASTIGGDVDVKSLIDLDWFQNKLFGSLRVPKQYFSQTDDSVGFNGGTSLSIISSRYGKQIKMIQNIMCQTITDLINLYLLDKGLPSYINKFTLRMQSPVTQEELDKRENMRNRLGVINDIMGQINEVVTDDVLKAKIVKILLSESNTNSDVISIIQEQIEKMENQDENKEKINEKSEEDNEIFDNNNEVDFEEPEDRGPRRPSSISTSESEETEEENTNTTETEETEEDSYLPSPNELNQDFVNMNTEI